jgi:hypothetical protein
MRIAEGHFAINDGNGCALRAGEIIHRHHEFRTVNASNRAARDNANTSRLVAMEEGKNAPDEAESRTGLGIRRRLNLDFGGSTQRYDALIGPPEGRPAFLAGPQPIIGVEHLIRLGQHP